MVILFFMALLKIQQSFNQYLFLVSKINTSFYSA